MCIRRQFYCHFRYDTGIRQDLPGFVLNVQQVAVSLKPTVCLMRKNLLCKYLAQLYTFLVEAVKVPCEALEHDLVLEMGKDRAYRFRSELIADDDAGRSVACEELISVLIVLAACKCHDLCCHICTELLLAGAVLDHNICLSLALLKADELKRNDVGALVEQLVEGMLSVGTRLTEDHRTCLIIHRLSVAVYALAVGFHIKLLQMCRETAQSLGIRKDCR